MRSKASRKEGVQRGQQGGNGLCGKVLFLVVGASLGFALSLQFCQLSAVSNGDGAIAEEGRSQLVRRASAVGPPAALAVPSPARAAAAAASIPARPARSVAAPAAPATSAKPCDREAECETYAGIGTTDLLAQSEVEEVAHLFPQPPYGRPAYPRGRFKGVYRCDVGTGCPTYSAAFLVSREQLLGRPVGPAQMANKLTNMESASYHVFGGRGESAVWTAVDAFDFSVEHIRSAAQRRRAPPRRLLWREAPRSLL